MRHFIWVFTVKVTLYRYPEGLGPVAQAEASPTAYPGVASLIPALSHTFVEIDREIISMVNSPSFGCCQSEAKVIVLNCLVKLAQEKVWLGELTVYKTSNQTNKISRRKRIKKSSKKLTTLKPGAW